MDSETCVNRMRSANSYGSGSKRSFTPYQQECYLSCHGCKYGNRFLKEAEKKDINDKKPSPVKKANQVNAKNGLNWVDLVNAYNEQKGTKYNSVATFARAIYKDKTLEQVGKELGVAKDTFRSLLVRLGIPRHPRSVKKKIKPKPPIRVETPIWEKPLCSECNKWAAVAKGMCKSCYRKSGKGKARNNG